MKEKSRGGIQWYFVVRGVLNTLPVVAALLMLGVAFAVTYPPATLATVVIIPSVSCLVFVGLFLSELGNYEKQG